MAHDSSLVDAAVATDKDVVFDNYRQGANRFENPADLRGSRNVHLFADLGARTDQGVRIDKRAIVDVGADVDVHGWHADYVAADVGAFPNRGTARNDANTLVVVEASDWQGVFVNET